MSDTPNLKEALESLRHDEGCSAGIESSYLCRCNVERLRAAARAELAALRDELATVKARFKQHRDADAPYRAEENERLRQQERDLRDAYYEGQWSERERAAGEQGW